MISRTPPKSVVKALEERLDVPLELVGGADEVEATSACSDPVALRTAFQSLVAEGFFLARSTPMVVPKRAAEEDVQGVDELHAEGFGVKQVT